MVKTPTKDSTTDERPVPPQTPPEPTAATKAQDEQTSAPAQEQAEQVGEVTPFAHFQAIEAPEALTFAAAYRYAGPGSVPRVPRRDLDAVTVQRLPADLRREVAGSPFYEAVKE